MVRSGTAAAPDDVDEIAVGKLAQGTCRVVRQLVMPPNAFGNPAFG